MNIFGFGKKSVDKLGKSKKDEFEELQSIIENQACKIKV
jgi:hypothetical protein